MQLENLYSTKLHRVASSKGTGNLNFNQEFSQNNIHETLF